jgi:zinc protease
MVFLLFLFSMVFLFSVVSVRPQSNGQTLDDITKEMIRAQGGKAAIENIKDMTIKGSIEVPQQGLRVSFTQYKKEPDKRRMEFEVQGMTQIQGFDGRRAWEIIPETGEMVEIPGEDANDIKRGSLALAWILDPGKYGISLSLKGREKDEGKTYLLLEQNFSDGDTSILYVDPDKYTIHKIKSSIMDEMGVKEETETYLSDYKNVKGYWMAHTLTSYLRGKEYMKISYKKIKVNTGLKDELFKMNK